MGSEHTAPAMRALDQWTNPERFMQALAAAGNGNFIDAAHGETPSTIVGRRAATFGPANSEG